MNVVEKSIENDPLGLMFAGGVTTYHIEGTVSTRRGILTGGVTITLTDSNSNVIETTSFDDDINPGWYQFTGLSAGTYTLIASKPCWSFNPSSQEVTITDADATGTDFTSIKNYYSIYGTVTEQGSGDPVAGASLNLYSLGTYLRSTVSDSSGQYMFNGLENGGYTITLDSGCVPEGMGSMCAFVNCANMEKNFECRGGLGESKRQEASSRLRKLSPIDNQPRQANNGDMEIQSADQGKTSAISRQNSARTEASVAEYLFYHCDHLGTVRLITDNNGAVVSRHDYEPFGVEIPTINDTASNTHQFTGHERDKNTGYDYMHFRYYGSNIGRFMKPDNVTGSPLNPQNWNLYSYVRGNPVNMNDPTGHIFASTLSHGCEGMFPSPIARFYDEGNSGMSGKPKAKDKPPVDDKTSQKMADKTVQDTIKGMDRLGLINHPSSAPKVELDYSIDGEGQFKASLRGGTITLNPTKIVTLGKTEGLNYEQALQLTIVHEIVIHWGQSTLLTRLGIEGDRNAGDSKSMGNPDLAHLTHSAGRYFANKIFNIPLGNPETKFYKDLYEITPIQQSYIDNLIKEYRGR